jgi:hypothetical protein
MPEDWQTRYGHRPLLLETLVKAQLIRGTCYPTESMWDRPPVAAAWTGSTKPMVKPTNTSTSQPR